MEDSPNDQEAEWNDVFGSNYNSDEDLKRVIRDTQNKIRWISFPTNTAGLGMFVIWSVHLLKITLDARWNALSDDRRINFWMAHFRPTATQTISKFSSWTEELYWTTQESIPAFHLGTH